jgi:hypothetical protein
MMASDGEAGRSAREQSEKKILNIQDRRVKSFGPKLGRILNLLIPDAHSTKSWSKGFDGEFAVGKLLDNFSEENEYFVLHDRKIPKSNANIDHIFISDRGVFVIDAKNYRGPIRLRDSSGSVNGREVLFIGKRNQTRLVDGVKKQVSTVETALKSVGFDVPVVGMLAFFNADFPILFKPEKVDGVLINGKGIEVCILSQPKMENTPTEKVSNFLREYFPSK